MDGFFGAFFDMLVDAAKDRVVETIAAATVPEGRDANLYERVLAGRRKSLNINDR